MTHKTKAVLTSKTVWGILIAWVAFLLNKWGYKISEELQGDTVDAIVVLLGVVIGPALALFGRWRANKPLSVTGSGTGGA